MIIDWGWYRGCEVALVENGEIVKTATLVGSGLPDLFYDLWVLEIDSKGNPSYVKWSSKNAKPILKRKVDMSKAHLKRFTDEFELNSATNFDEAFKSFCLSYGNDFDSYVDAIKMIIGMGYDGMMLIDRGLALDHNLVTNN